MKKFVISFILVIVCVAAIDYNNITGVDNYSCLSDLSVHQLLRIQKSLKTISREPADAPISHSTSDLEQRSDQDAESTTNIFNITALPLVNKNRFVSIYICDIIVIVDK